MPSETFISVLYTTCPPGIEGVLCQFLNILDILVLIIIGLALIFFLWGLAKFILNAGDEEERRKGKSLLIWGLIALFVMVSVWGIINFFQSSFFYPYELIIPPEAPGVPYYLQDPSPGS